MHGKVWLRELEGHGVGIIRYLSTDNKLQSLLIDFVTIEGKFTRLLSYQLAAK